MKSTMDNHDSSMDIKCYVYRRVNLRSDVLEYELYIGRGVLDSLFDRVEQRPDVKSLILPFPERWLNILEQYDLIQRIEKYCPNCKSVIIKTQSPHIITTLRKEQVLLIEKEDTDYLPKSGDKILWTENAMNLFTNGLNILGVSQDGE